MQVFQTKIWNISQALQVTYIKLNLKSSAEKASSRALLLKHVQ